MHDAHTLADRLIDLDTRSPAEDVGSQAVRALSADLLPGWGDDWAVAAAEDWRQMRLHALEVVVARLIDAHRWAEADAAAQVVVGADPLRETARAVLIGGSRRGRHSTAVEELERYRLLLEVEPESPRRPESANSSSASRSRDAPRCRLRESHPVMPQTCWP